MSFDSPIVVHMDGAAETDPISLHNIEAPNNLRSRYRGQDADVDMTIAISHAQIAARLYKGTDVPKREKHTVVLELVETDTASATYGNIRKATFILEHAEAYDLADVNEVLDALTHFLSTNATRTKLMNLEA